MYLQAGEKLYNGVIVSEDLAQAYNSLQDRIQSFKDAGKNVPMELINGSHNLIASTSVMVK